MEKWAWWIIISLIEPTELSKNVCLCLIIPKREFMRQTIFDLFEKGVSEPSEIKKFLFFTGQIKFHSH